MQIETSLYQQPASVVSQVSREGSSVGAMDHLKPVLASSPSSKKQTFSRQISFKQSTLSF